MVEPTSASSTPSRRAMVGRYELCAELASGGMGRVYLARSAASGIDKLVALKCIHPELATEQRFVEMFLDEARIAARIVHPNVCSVFEFGEADGRYYLAMEYLEGESVSRLVRALARAGPRAADHDLLAAYLVAQAAEGLHAAHSLTDDAGQPLEVVHRDVSPHNLFVTYDGGVRVVDFGIASARGRLHETTTGSVKGKFAYMSPEQMRREKVDRRSDVWSLGVVLWELLTLERMRAEESEVDLILSVLNEPVHPPSTVRPIDPALEAIVMGALQKKPQDRTPTAREMAQALQRWIVGQGAVVGMSELAELMARAFPEGRARRRQLLDAARRGEVTADLLPAATPSAIDVEIATAVPPRRRATAGRGPWLAAAGVSAVIGLAGGAWALGGGSSASGAETGSMGVAAPSPIDAGVAIATSVVSVGDAGTEPRPDASGAELSPRDAGEARVSPEARAARPRVVTSGTVRIETPGGWADVVIDGERRGRTPMTLELPAGPASVELRPFGLSPPAGDTSLRRRIEVGARTVRVVVPLDE